MDSSGVVLAKIKVLLSKFMNCRVNFNNGSVNTVPDKSRRCGSDTKATVSY
jgi:hypothetical protein